MNCCRAKNPITASLCLLDWTCANNFGLSLDAFAPNSVIFVLPIKPSSVNVKLFATGALTLGSFSRVNQNRDSLPSICYRKRNLLKLERDLKKFVFPSQRELAS